MVQKEKNFFYPVDPAVMTTYKKVSLGRGRAVDLEVLSKNFILEGGQILQTEDDYSTDDSVSYLNKEKCYVARQSGFVCFDSKSLMVLPFVGVNYEKLISFVIIPVHDFSKVELKTEDILNAFGVYPFKDLIPDAIVKECLEMFRRSGGYKIIYQGIPMTPDREDDIILNPEFHFKEDFSFRSGDRKTLTPREIEFYHKVSVGDSIGQFKHWIDGKPGIDVFGHPIPQRKIKSYYKIGQGIKKNFDGEVIATREGILRINFHRELSVHKGHIIKDPLKVDFKNDNDEVVIISGVISSNLNIKVNGDLVIIGSVDNVHIECEKNILITQSINNKSVIEAGENCLAQFVSYSKMNARKDIVIGQYALNSDIHARRNVSVLASNFGEIVGGTITADMGDIVASQVGSISGTPTWLKVGSKEMVAADIRQHKKNIEQFNQEKFFLEQKITKLKPIVSGVYERMKSSPRSFSDIEKGKFVKNFKQLKRLVDDLKKMEEKIKDEEESIEADKTSKVVSNKIELHNRVFGGVTVEIKNVKHHFKYSYFNGLVLSKHPVLPKIESVIFSENPNGQR